MVVWGLHGFKICRERFRAIIGINDWTLKLWIHDVRQASTSLPEDGRASTARKVRPCPKRGHVNAWLRWVYDTAESLAEVLKDEEWREQRAGAAKEVDEQLDEVDFAQANPASELQQEPALRYLPPARVSELVDLQEHQTNGDKDAAGKALFFQTHNEEWSHILKFRAVG